MQNDLQAVIMQPNFKVQEEPWRSTCRVEVFIQFIQFSSTWEYNTNRLF